MAVLSLNACLAMRGYRTPRCLAGYDGGANFPAGGTGSQLMDFGLEDISPTLKPFQEEVRAWMKDAFKGAEHLRWGASWSTREDKEEYAFRRQLGAKLGAKGWLFPMMASEYGGG